MSDGVKATERWSPLRGVYAWVIRHAEGPYAWAIMAAIAFAESSFLPLPPDLMLIPMVLAHRSKAFRMRLHSSVLSCALVTIESRS